MTELEKTSKEIRSVKEIAQEKSRLIEKERAKIESQRELYLHKTEEIQAKSGALLKKIKKLDEEEREAKELEKLEAKEEELKTRITLITYFKARYPNFKKFQSQLEYFLRAVEKYNKVKDSFPIPNRIYFMSRNIGRPYDASIEILENSITKTMLLLEIQKLEQRINELEAKK